MTTVLLIEKDQPAVNLLEWALRDHGFDVMVAVDEPASKEVATKPHVIVFNTHMPGDGKRLWVSTLRFLVPGVGVIDLAAPGTESFDTGADAYLTQPYAMDSLLTIIERLASESRRDASEVS